jgi:hypothetical protein
MRRNSTMDMVTSFVPFAALGLALWVFFTQRRLENGLATLAASGE